MIKIVNKKNKPSLLTTREIKNWIIKAESLMNKQDYARAEIEFQKILKKTNNIEHMYYNTIINNHLGIIYAKNKQYTKSLYRFSLILEFNPDNKLAKKNLNLIAKKIVNNEEIFDKSLIEAVKTDYAQAKQHYIENDFDKLEPIAFRLINDYEINSQTSLWVSYSHCFMGLIMSNQKKYKDSIDHYIQAIKLNKNNSQAEKMIFDTIDEYVSEEVDQIVSENGMGYFVIENSDIFKEKEKIIEEQNNKLEQAIKTMQEKENELHKKDKIIEELKSNLQNAQTQIEVMESLPESDYTEESNAHNNSENVNILNNDDTISNENQNDDVAEMRKRLSELEKQNQEQKNKIEKLTEKSKRLENENEKYKSNAEKWKNYSLLYEKEFTRLTSQLEHFVKMYRDMNLKRKQGKFEESA